MDMSELDPLVAEIKAATDTRIKSVVDRVGDVETKHAELSAQIQELAQKGAKRGDSNGVETKNAIVEALKASPDLERMRRGTLKHTRIELPSGWQSKGVAVTSQQSVVTTFNLGATITPGTRKLFLRDLIPTIPVTNPFVQFIRESSFTNAAAVVPEATAKPQSDLAFEIVQQSVSTLAHFVRATKQILDDNGTLAGYIEMRLRYGLALEEDDQILNGNGTAPNFAGLLLQAPTFTPTVVSGDTRIDILRKAIGQLETMYFNAGVIVLNPLDWEQIELIKDSQQRFLVGDPSATAATPSLWDVPVVATMAMPQGTYLVGDMMMAARIYDRQEPTLDISDSDGDNFTKNLITLRVEERLALTVFRPTAMLKGTFS